MKYNIQISHILITKIASTCSYSYYYIDDVANAKLLYLWRVYPHAITTTAENCSCIPKLDVKLLIYSFFAKLFSFEYYCFFFVLSTLKAKYQKINIISRRIQTYSRSKYQKTSLYRRESWGQGRGGNFIF